MNARVGAVRARARDTVGSKLERVNAEYEHLVDRMRQAEKAYEDQAKVSRLEGQLEMQRIQSEISMRGVMTRNVRSHLIT